MAITRLGGANAITGTLPAANINDTSIGNITALPAGVGGKVLQVVTATDSTRRTTTSLTWVTSSNTLSVTITPSSASNKIFIELNTSIFGVGLRTYTTIFRDSTNLGDASYGMSQSTTGTWTGLGMSYLDSPSSTSALTYQFYWQNGGSGTAYMNGDNGTASITAFEIAG